MERDAPLLSPLSQRISRGMQSVRVEIYADGEGGWILEIIDDYDNATLWENTFAFDEDALDEALRAIDEEGIEAFIGPNLHALH